MSMIKKCLKRNYNEFDKGKLRDDPNMEEEHKDETKSKTKAVKLGEAHNRTFQSAWKDKFSWLDYNGDLKVMYCKFCRSHGKDNAFTKGSTRFKIDALYEHSVIKDHTDVFEDSIAKKAMERVVSQLISNQDFKVISLVKLVYYTCSEKEAFKKFESLYELFCLMLQDLPELSKDYKKGIHYLNSKGFNKLLSIMSLDIRKTTVDAINRSPYVAIIIDESLCNSNKENLIIFIKYLDTKTYTLKISYLENIIIQDKKGQTIFKAVEKSLSNLNIPIQKVYALGTDGAENMVGVYNGVNTHFRSINPFLINIHCWLHRLALASKDITKDIAYLKEYKEIICDIYSFFKKSAVKNKLPKDFQLQFQEEDVNILRMCETRWLSLHRCVVNLQKSMTSVLMVLDSELNADRGKNLKRNNDEKKYFEKYEAIYEEMLSFRFQTFTNFLSDVLFDTSKLILGFQKNDIELNEASELLQICIDELRMNYNIETNQFGENYRKFLEEFEEEIYIPEFIFFKSSQMKENTTNLLKNFAICLHKNIKQRLFPESLVTNFKIFSIDIIRNLKQDDIGSFGREELDLLIVHFGVEKVLWIYKISSFY